MAYFQGLCDLWVFSGRFQPGMMGPTRGEQPTDAPDAAATKIQAAERGRAARAQGRSKPSDLAETRGENQSWIRSPFFFECFFFWVWSFLGTIFGSALKYIWYISDTSSWVITVHANYGKLQEDQKRFLSHSSTEQRKNPGWWGLYRGLKTTQLWWRL